MNPKPLLPDVNAWEHAVLHRRIVDALAALPTYFRTETFISGIPVPDLHTLHGALGASIEEQTVATLNAMRTTWDPDGQYALYTFIRQPQTFPDVLLRRPPSPDANATPPEILLGIESAGMIRSRILRGVYPAFRSEHYALFVQAHVGAVDLRVVSHHDAPHSLP